MVRVRDPAVLSRRVVIGLSVPLLATSASGSRDLPSSEALDARAFVEWYTWLAEAIFFWPGHALAPEVRDCSSLVRFAYRNALARHTAEWARTLGLTDCPAFPDVASRAVAPMLMAGPEQRSYFADATHLMRYNFRHISSDLAAARSADALFWAHPSDHGAGHVMIYLGRSQFDRSGGPYVVYHTGPEGRWKGEPRRPALDELLHHPEPRWRPVRGNPAFLGVYRWRFLSA